LPQTHVKTNQQELDLTHDSTSPAVGLENRFDIAFVAELARREKQIQQSYRPIIGVHKWFARRPGSVFRSLLLSEFGSNEALRYSYWRPHALDGVIADPFMGGGTPLYEANRLGFNVIGKDINPMAYWVVHQSLSPLDRIAFAREAELVASHVESRVGKYYKTACLKCGQQAHVKYFLWVKRQTCPECSTANDLFPGYLLAEDVRHPKNVLVCHACGELNEFSQIPTTEAPLPCSHCGTAMTIEGPARRNRITCSNCKVEFKYPAKSGGAPSHRMWGLEYHCPHCKPTHSGRFFKRPDVEDARLLEEAQLELMSVGDSLSLPDDSIPDGDETRRLHRWGYRRFAEMFNERQLLGLGLLRARIAEVRDSSVRNALLTVFSDFLRYQNMLCRYDTYALKCQDIFSVHGFPVGLIQCENNLLGIPRVGSGAFRHFVEKYQRAKEYCERPFETQVVAGHKRIIYTSGEGISAEIVESPGGKSEKGKWASIEAGPAADTDLQPNTLDGVFTDPPYYDNVQYAELMDFCYAWLRPVLEKEFPAFRKQNTRAQGELTGNETMGRDLIHFAAGLSAVFVRFAAALKPNAPFVFTYHHNDPKAYMPLVVAILDAGLYCTACLPAPAEMEASLHIAGSKSSVVDSIFVCRTDSPPRDQLDLQQRLSADVHELGKAGLVVSLGDRNCLFAGHVARLAINRLHSTWASDLSQEAKASIAYSEIDRVAAQFGTKK
jgi:adenine-specific DNA methylase